MSPARRLAVLACAALVFAGAVAAQRGADRTRAADRGGELLYLPNEKLLTHFTGGLSSVVADLVWLECVHYVAKEAKGERNFEWLNLMVNTVVTLDPYFADAYRYGGMLLAALRADDDAGIDLLNRGIVQNPTAWTLPYEGAMIYLLNRRDWPGSKEVAAHYITMAAANPDAPDMTRLLAEKLGGQFDLVEVEREMWRDLLASDDQLLRDLAARKLREVEIRETVKTLNERAEQFRQARGAAPATLADLGLDREEDGLGGRFFFDESGRAWNSTLLDGEADVLRQHLQRSVDAYREKMGVLPMDLGALVRDGFLETIPPHPYPSGRWAYEPSEGVVRGVID